MPKNQELIYKALQNLPRLVGIEPSQYTTQRLGGLTNLVYRVEIADEKLIVRIPGEGTSEFIDRAVELHNASAAEKAGMSAPILWADASTGVMISRCIEDIETMSPALFKTRQGSVERAGKCLSQLHQSGVGFEFRFELFSVIEDYLKILSTKDLDLPDGFAKTVKDAEPIKQILSDADIALAPCHCDPLSENFLDDGQRVWLVDWEYSGMNDPMWDLGDLSVEAEFDEAQDAVLLHAYFGRSPTQSELGRMVIYKAMCDLLWALWGLIQHANGADAEDYNAYALNRFERCQKLMQSPDFQGHLNAIA